MKQIFSVLALPHSVVGIVTHDLMNGKLNTTPYVIIHYILSIIETLAHLDEDICDSKDARCTFDASRRLCFDPRDKDRIFGEIQDALDGATDTPVTPIDKTFEVWHMIDRTEKWHASTETLTKELQTPQETINFVWIKIVGNFEALRSNNETGFDRKSTQTFLRKSGIEHTVRAKHQHERRIENKGAASQHRMNTIEEQLKKEEISEIQQLSIQTSFNKNASTNVGGGMRRRQRSLPSFSYLWFPREKGTNIGDVDLARTISVEKIDVATEIARINRASGSLPTEGMNQFARTLGELTDLHTTDGKASVTSWQKPETVFNSLLYEGPVRFARNAQDLSCRYAERNYSWTLQRRYLGVW